jgi:hypothetical protein
MDFFSPVSRLALGPTWPAIQWVTRKLSPRVKESEGENLKNKWMYTTISSYDFTNAPYVTKTRIWFIYYQNVLRHRGGKKKFGY